MKFHKHNNGGKIFIAYFYFLDYKISLGRRCLNCINVISPSIKRQSDTTNDVAQTRNKTKLEKKQKDLLQQAGKNCGKQQSNSKQKKKITSILEREITKQNTIKLHVYRTNT